MLALIGEARQELLVENFIFRTDAVGNEFASCLRERARDGVAVRALHDPVGSMMGRRLPIGFRLAGSNSEVRIFNPPRLSRDFFRYGRDHRKMMLADGHKTIIGGMCLADVWAGNCVQSCTWRDSAVRVEGPIAREVGVGFEALWRRSMSVRPLRWGQARSRNDWQPTHVGSVPVRLVADSGRGRVTEAVLIEAIGAARSSVLVTNPYLLPPARLVKTFVAAAKRGVHVRILIPGRNNHPVVAWAAEAGLGTVLAAGIEVWLWTGPLIHAKTVVIDGTWSLVGSSNLDPLSLRRNCELNVEIHGTAFASHLETAFASDLARSRRLRFEEWSGRTGRRKALTRSAWWLRRFL